MMLVNTKRQADAAFKFRVLDIEEVAKVETIYWQIMNRASNFARLSLRQKNWNS